MTVRQKPVLLLATNHSYMFYRFRRQLIEGFQKDYQVVLSTPFEGHEDDLQALGIELRQIEMDRRSINPLKDLSLIRTYEKLLDDVRPDVVITYSIKPNVYLAPLCRKRQIPFFVHVQGLGTAFQKPGLRTAAEILYRRGTKGARGVFFENQANCDFFVDHDLARMEQTIVLPGAGVPLEEYTCFPVKQMNSDELPFCSSNKSLPSGSEKLTDPVHLAYLGRFMKEKGMDELLWAMQELRKEGYSFVFDFAGFCEDEYTEQLDQLQKEGWAVSHGFLQDPRKLYTKADCVILPSWHEGMSNVLLEAAAMGRPLIASDIPGCREAVINGKSGLLCEVRNAQSLKQALEIFLQKSPAERQEMGIAGRRHMEQTFSRDRVVKLTLEEVKNRTEKN